jgi:NAD(P)-dependent dehydrogenase (short-subunit alcohol dehydrogenase family)
MGSDCERPLWFVYCPGAEIDTMPTNSVVLITGASTGFGRAAAETLAARGYTVLASMRDSNGKNAPHRNALQSLTSRERWALHVIDLDVTQDASVDGAAREILSRFGRIDVVINNAGIAALGVTEAYTVQQFQQLFNVNVFGVVRVNRAVIPSMCRQRSGLLIHVSSGAGRVTVPYMAAYCGSKFALEALADAYRFELSPFGIDSVVVEPGMHRTPILENFAAPADQARVADYGSLAECAARVKGVFEGASRATETPGPEGVVDAFVNLIEMPAGERPFRTVPTPALQPLLDPYNAAAAEMRQIVAVMFGVPELMVLQKAASAAD